MLWQTFTFALLIALALLAAGLAYLWSQRQSASRDAARLEDELQRAQQERDTLDDRHDAVARHLVQRESELHAEKQARQQDRDAAGRELAAARERYDKELDTLQQTHERERRADREAHEKAQAAARDTFQALAGKTLEQRQRAVP